MVSKLEARYPKLHKSVPAVAAVVAKLRQNPCAELEARFGVIENERFRAGVTRPTIERVIDMMQASSHVAGDEEWREEQDFFFDQNGAQLRTRVAYDHSQLTVTPTTIRKEVLATQDLKALSASNMDIRVSLKNEVEMKHVDACVKTKLVRIKQRRRFTTENGAWAFDFALTWSGKTKTEAEHAQSEQDPEFEIECELIDAPRMLSLYTDSRIALSLILKMHDLLDLTDVEIVPVL